MTIDIVEIYAALRRDHPTRPLPRDLEEWMILEITRLREEAHQLRLMVEEAARAENLNAEDAKRERAAVVAWLRGGAGLRGGECAEEWDDLWVAARDIERGEHRREEER